MQLVKKIPCLSLIIGILLFASMHLITACHYRVSGSNFPTKAVTGKLENSPRIHSGKSEMPVISMQDEDDDGIDLTLKHPKSKVSSFYRLLIRNANFIESGESLNARIVSRQQLQQYLAARSAWNLNALHEIFLI